MFLFFIFFFGLTQGILLKIHKKSWVNPPLLNLYSSGIYKEHEIDNLFGSEYDIEMSDEEQMYHKLCKNNNETHYTFKNIYMFNLINYLRNNLLNELKELDILEEELKEMN